jgi:TetR/AcrR family transcriptional repressor of nem operon
MVGFMKDAKEHILLISLQLFSQKGFKEVTMKEIVDKTGLSKGAFYHYFNSKEQVFTEVIQYFFMDMMLTDYSLFSQSTLKEFYREVLDRFEDDKLASQKLLPKQKGSTFNTNYYYLIFDAMRMLPDFKERHLDQQKQEIKTWKDVIETARKNNEIATGMSDKQVAKLFIYLGDGVNINLAMASNPGKKKDQLKTLWEGLYNTLKT